MTGTNPHVTEHEIMVDAAAETVYGLIERAGEWPLIFPPTVQAEVLERDGGHERLRLWATANGQVKTWTSRRAHDPDGRRIAFRQDRSAAPVAAMGGEWILEPADAGRTRVRLLHDFRAVDDDPGHVRWIEEAVDRNSTAELASLKAAAELPGGVAEYALEFEDTVLIDGAATDAYAFIYEAGRWKERLPHVGRVTLTEDVPGVQVLEMDTRAGDGSVHTTRSIRLCTPATSISYKQTVLPALLSAHLGRWSFEPSAGGVAVTSWHAIVIKPAAIEGVLGAGADVRQAKEFVRNALSTNSRATLQLAKSFAEQAVPARPGS